MYDNISKVNDNPFTFSFAFCFDISYFIFFRFFYHALCERFHMTIRCSAADNHDIRNRCYLAYIKCNKIQCF